MKKTIFTIGLTFALVGSFQASLYLSDYNFLTEYEKGYFLGSVFQFSTGLVIISLVVNNWKIKWNYVLYLFKGRVKR